MMWQEAMQNFVNEMLHDSPAALRIMSLWKEYEDQATPEACFVKGELAWFFSRWC
jgi:putative hydrolase of HD superfamily